MWYLFTIVLTVLPIGLGLGAVAGLWLKEEFYKYPLYDDYEN